MQLLYTHKETIYTILYTQRKFYLQNDGYSNTSEAKYVTSGREGSICSLKYSIAIVDKSNNSSVTL